MLKGLLVGSLLLLWASAVFATELTGTVSWVYDGDTLEVTGVGRVRLLGIDTPEGKDSERDNYYQRKFNVTPQRLRQIAQLAKRYNIDAAKDRLVRLVTENDQRDKYHRLLAYLYLPDGRLLNRSLLENGLATVFRRYQFRLKNDFFAAENTARSAKIGLWQH